MKMKFLAVLAAAATMVAATGANALTYNWSFNAISGTSTGPVTGTISGLQVGANDGTGLTVNVLSSPSGNVLGGGWTFDSSKVGPAFVIAPDKSVTYADALFIRAAGGAEGLFFGSSCDITFCPELISYIEPDGLFSRTDHYNFTPGAATTFAPAPVPVPASLPLLAFGLGGLGYMARRKRKAS